MVFVTMIVHQIYIEYIGLVEFKYIKRVITFEHLSTQDTVYVVLHYLV